MEYITDYEKAGLTLLILLFICLFVYCLILLIEHFENQRYQKEIIQARRKAQRVKKKNTLMQYQAVVDDIVSKTELERITREVKK